MQLIDGGRIEPDKSSFPSLKKLIRLQSILALKNDFLNVTGRALFGQTRSSFLERVYYPEMSNQALCVMKKWKLSNQCRIAKAELANRRVHGRRSFFLDMTDDELTQWLHRAVQPLAQYMSKLDQSNVTVGSPTPSIGVGLPYENHLNYSFMTRQSLASNQPFMNSIIETTLANARAGLSVPPVRNPVRNHPTNLAAIARLAKNLPISVSVNLDHTIHPDDRDDVIQETRELSEFMSFLSFGVYRPYRKVTGRSCVVKDTTSQSDH